MVVLSRTINRLHFSNTTFEETLTQVVNFPSVHIIHFWSSSARFSGSLVDEVDAEEVQYQASQHEIRKRTLLASTFELLLVLRVGLDPQAGREHELSDRRAEAGEEGVEGLSQNQHVSTLSSSSSFPIPHLLCRL